MKEHEHDEADCRAVAAPGEVGQQHPYRPTRSATAAAALIAAKARALECLRALWRFVLACLTQRQARDARWALALLAMACVMHFGWMQAPAAMQSRVWAASQSLLVSFLLLMAARRYDWSVRVVAVLASTWQLLTAGCYLAYLWRPFTGECAGALDYPLAMVALAASVGLAWLIYRGGCHVG